MTETDQSHEKPRDTSGTRRLRIPVLPLREVVLFPGVTVPVGAGRPGTLRAIETALKREDRLIFAVSQRQNIENVTPEVLYTTGTVSRIGQIQRGLGGVQLLLHGEYRGTVLQYAQSEGHIEAVVVEAQDLPPADPTDAAFLALYKELRERAAELGQKSGLPEDVVQQVLEGVTEAGRFADLVAGYIDIAPAERQGLLETLGIEERMRRALVHVQRQLALLDAQEEIKEKVQEELGERQREMLLRDLPDVLHLDGEDRRLVRLEGDRRRHEMHLPVRVILQRQRPQVHHVLGLDLLREVRLDRHRLLLIGRVDRQDLQDDRPRLELARPQARALPGVPGRRVGQLFRGCRDRVQDPPREEVL